MVEYDYVKADDRTSHASDQDPLLDLAGPLLPLLQANLQLPIGLQIARWQEHYEVVVPELPPLLYADYDGLEGGWRRVAEERIFPRLPESLPRMGVALSNLRGVCKDLCARARRILELKASPVMVAYVGLGNGAGWATTWQGRPAVLLGLENIAELGWQEPDTLEALLAHEIGHLFMVQIRGNIECLTEDPLLALCEEGFAQHCEHLVMGRETWHCSSQAGWLEWCTAHERELAGLYLEAMNDWEKWRRFFGSWFEVGGWRQTGYFLGCRFVQQESRDHSLPQLATWSHDCIRSSVRSFLNSLANH